jgi:serine-type D-Ala-D-Ala carboxypeptidase
MKSFPKATAFLKEALEQKQASAAAFLLRRPGEEDFELYLGNHAYAGNDALSRETGADSLFDLASVTKILSTVNLLFMAESEEKFSFDDPVRKYFSSFPSAATKLSDLMAHRSGLPAHIEFFRKHEKGEAILGDQKPLLNWICEAGISNPGTQVYSDLGFMLLGMLLESLYGKPLPEIFHERIVSRLKIENLGFVTLPHAPAPSRLYGLLAEKNRFVATETCPWRKKTLQGEVHDDNCWAFGGCLGHAGLFGNARDAMAAFEHLLKQVKANPHFLDRKQPDPGIFSFGLSTYPGLRPFPGPAFATAFGHTGFTGTNIWYHEPSGIKTLLFSNRVHPSRSDGRWIDTRLQFHKILWEELGL